MSYIGKKSNSRLVWGIDPITKVVPDKKKYDRKKNKSKFQKILDQEMKKY